MQLAAGWPRCGRAWRRRAWHQQLPMVEAGAAAVRGLVGAMTVTGVPVQRLGRRAKHGLALGPNCHLPVWPLPPLLTRCHPPLSTPSRACAALLFLLVCACLFVCRVYDRRTQDRRDRDARDEADRKRTQEVGG